MQSKWCRLCATERSSTDISARVPPNPQPLHWGVGISAVPAGVSPVRASDDKRGEGTPLPHLRGLPLACVSLPTSLPLGLPNPDIPSLAPFSSSQISPFFCFYLFFFFLIIFLPVTATDASRSRWFPTQLASFRLPLPGSPMPHESRPRDPSCHSVSLLSSPPEPPLFPKRDLVRGPEGRKRRFR
ncbi:hypothetical protein CGRA01v4_05847 [Colletotrichum graminicola]|nr:hypothetical protein CGRA01v4_05847 [Colletotrichum graminicola]